MVPLPLFCLYQNIHYCILHWKEWRWLQQMWIFSWQPVMPNFDKFLILYPPPWTPKKHIPTLQNTSPSIGTRSWILHLHGWAIGEKSCLENLVEKIVLYFFYNLHACFANKESLNKAKSLNPNSPHWFWICQHFPLHPMNFSPVSTVAPKFFLIKTSISLHKPSGSLKQTMVKVGIAWMTDFWSTSLLA